MFDITIIHVHNFLTDEHKYIEIQPTSIFKSIKIIWIRVKY